jgi:hypothetical protein
MTPERIIEVFFPTQAPHLAPIVAEMEAIVRQQLEGVPDASLPRLLEAGAAIARERAAFEKFRERIGIEQPAALTRRERRALAILAFLDALLANRSTPRRERASPFREIWLAMRAAHAEWRSHAA